MKKQIMWESQHIEESEPDILDDEEYFDDEDQPGPTMGRAIATPFGMFRVDDEYSNPYKLFDMWIGHTNFPLTNSVVKTIMDTPGVEVLKVISPYRFIVAPGKMFEWRDVRALIQRRVCTNEYEQILPTLPEDIRDRASSLIEDSLKHEGFWRMYIFPNGEIYHRPYEGLLDYKDGLKEFDDLVKMSNGIVITSE